MRGDRRHVLGTLQDVVAHHLNFTHDAGDVVAIVCQLVNQRSDLQVALVAEQGGDHFFRSNVRVGVVVLVAHGFGITGTHASAIRLAVLPLVFFLPRRASRTVIVESVGLIDSLSAVSTKSPNVSGARC